MFLGLTQDYRPNSATPLGQYKQHQLLVNNQGDFSLMTNVCPHQGSMITQCRTSQLQCPYHGWKFGLDGQGQDNQGRLDQHQIFTVNDMLLSEAIDFVPTMPLKHMTLMKHRTDLVEASVDAIMDVFLDIDHISVAHAGVYDPIGLSRFGDIRIETFDQGSLQTVPAQQPPHILTEDHVRNIGAMWLAIYPGTMIEWQPGALFVTVATNLDYKHSSVEVYKYRDVRYSQQTWTTNQQVWEKAWSQDRELSRNIVNLCMDPEEPLKRHHRAWINDAV